MTDRERLEKIGCALAVIKDFMTVYYEALNNDDVIKASEQLVMLQCWTKSAYDILPSDIQEYHNKFEKDVYDFFDLLVRVRDNDLDLIDIMKKAAA